MPLPYQIETFDVERKPARTIKIELPNPDFQRYWFLTDPLFALFRFSETALPSIGERWMATKFIQDIRMTYVPGL